MINVLMFIVASVQKEIVDTNEATNFAQMCQVKCRRNGKVDAQFY